MLTNGYMPSTHLTSMKVNKVDINKTLFINKIDLFYYI